jgi:hypothetical protein
MAPASSTETQFTGTSVRLAENLKIGSTPEHCKEDIFDRPRHGRLNFREWLHLHSGRRQEKRNEELRFEWSPGSVFSFWLGTGAVSIGVAPAYTMFLMGEHSLPTCRYADGRRHAHWHGHDRGWICITSYGLLPQNVDLLHPLGSQSLGNVAGGRSAGVSALMLMAVLVAALIIDVAKPASLGFVVPGMRVEYGLTGRWLPGFHSLP